MKIIFTILALSILIGCNKTEGVGGTSSISGFIKSQNHSFGEAEITEVIFTQGTTVEHGDFWILNNLIGATQFYIYYDNPTWASDADPALAGRTGIAVEFNYSDSNVEIAEHTLMQLELKTAGQYSITRNADILVLTNVQLGKVTDADKMTSPFEINTAQQGDDAVLNPIYPAIDEKVYLVYGEHTVYDDFSRTGGNGEFQFNYLTPGNYTLYAISKDTVNGGTLIVEEAVEIVDKKSIVIANEIRIVN